MKVAAIGRSEIMYNSIEILLERGFEVPLIITHKEAPEYTRTSKDFENLAQKIGAKYIYTSKIVDFRDDIIQSECDIAISFNYPTIIPQNVIDLFPLGILNAHGGDLPRYRGNACQAWAIINGEERIGLCVYKMVGDLLDFGKIIVKDYFRININTKITEIWNWFIERIPEMFYEALKKLERDPNYYLEIPSDNPKDWLRCYPRLPEDGRIDWNKSNLEILRLINATNKPYSGAFCYFEEKKVIIWDAELYEDNENYLAIPGQIASIEPDGSIIVITGKGKLRIKEIECEEIIGKPNKLIKSIRNRLK